MPFNGEESIQPAGCSSISTDNFCVTESIASNSVTDAVSIALHWLHTRFFSSNYCGGVMTWLARAEVTFTEVV